MKIIGIGVDIVENDRIKKATKNKDFIKRIFTKNEINLSKLEKNNIGFYAKRFAAKEAFAKSLGTGFRKGLNLFHFL
jgi:holo-[acyl-carrier protein] synthase